MIILNQNISKIEKYVIWILIVLLLILRLKMFIKIFADNVEKRFDTSNYEINRPLLIGINTKVIGLIKDEIGGKIMAEFVGIRPKL